MTTPQLLEIRARPGELALAWDDGTQTRLPYAKLRSQCPCAQCRQIRGTGAEVEAVADVTLEAIDPYGPKAVNLRFSDGHGRGIYPFTYLRELGAAE